VITYEISSAQAKYFLARGEGHFVDNKSRAISPGKLTKALSAFANADGGELLVGVTEVSKGSFEWDGFESVEGANGHIQHLEEHFPYGGDFTYEFLEARGLPGLVLRIQVFKTRDIRAASDGRSYIRRGAQSLPVDGDVALTNLRRSKGLISHEDNTVSAAIVDITNSLAVIDFMLEIIPEAEPEVWLRKQRMIVDGLPTVAGVLLFADEPQVYLPKASIKIYRYRTAAAEGSRETLAFDPITVDGCLYRQIFDAVDKTVEFTEQIQKMSDAGLVHIRYPKEALHEVITNAVLHRDYAHNDDVHVRIFDNRIEVESPGRLPAHITPKNILTERFARNPTVVRIINKFPNPPNKDVGEGLNTAFAAMEKLRLREPAIVERDNSVLVIIRHESLASPEQQIVEYLKSHETINNSKAREITGVAADHPIRRAFKKLVATGEIEQVPGTERATTKYRLPEH
jgi:ATP-dependent DNA helicase RecG